MKRFCRIVLAALLCALLAGCAAPASGEIPEAEEKEILPEELPLDLVFTSGAGGWGTELRLERDGTFSGVFHDSEMGDAGEGYPNGSVYICTFSGRFGDVTAQESGCWSMKLLKLTAVETEGDEWIRDGIRYIASYPYGLDTDGGDEFRLYPPETHTADVTESFLSWWPGRFRPADPSGTLGCWGLRNMDREYGFFTYE